MSNPTLFDASEKSETHLAIKASEGLGFEEALNELKKIVQKFEEGTLSLDQSISEYQRGIELQQYCKEYLEKAKLKIETLTPES
jgi:exodeoxyribonuclease VII small subunit